MEYALVFVAVLAIVVALGALVHAGASGVLGGLAQAGASHGGFSDVVMF